jgi:WD40 repeat protein
LNDKNGDLYCGTAENCLKIVNLNNSNETNQPSIKSISTNSWIRSFLKKDNKLLSGLENGEIVVWDIINEDPKQIKIIQGHSKYVTSLINYENDTFISGSWDKSIKVWDLESETCLKIIQTNDHVIKCLVLFEQDKVISGEEDGNISIWSLEESETNSLLKTWKAHDSWINKLLLNGENELISGSFDKKIKVWNLKTYECICTLDGHSSYVRDLLINQEGQLISFSGDKTIKFWNNCVKKSPNSNV